MSYRMFSYPEQLFSTCMTGYRWVSNLKADNTVKLFKKLYLGMLFGCYGALFYQLVCLPSFIVDAIVEAIEYPSKQLNSKVTPQRQQLIELC